MNEQAKKCLIAMIKGLSEAEGNQFYETKRIDEEGIETLIQFIKNY